MRYLFQKRHFAWLQTKLGESDTDEASFNVVIWTLAQGLKETNPTFNEKAFYEGCRAMRLARLANVQAVAA